MIPVTNAFLPLLLRPRIRLPGVEGKGCGVLAGIQLCALQLAERNRSSALYAVGESIAR